MQEAMFIYVSPEERVPAKHPLRPIRAMIAKALAQMDRRLEKICSQTSSSSIAPERLIQALLLQVLYSIRSERLLVEQLECYLLFRWFLGLSVDEPVWDHSTSDKNRNRLRAAVARELASQTRLHIERNAGRAGISSRAAICGASGKHCTRIRPATCDDLVEESGATIIRGRAAVAGPPPSPGGDVPPVPLHLPRPRTAFASPPCPVSRLLPAKEMTMTSMVTQSPIEALKVLEQPAVEVGPGCSRRDLALLSGVRIWLVEIQPGCEWPRPDEHDDLGEHVLVIEGELIEGDRRYPAGTYLKYAPYSTHRPRSETGVTLFGFNLIHIRPQ